jgi:hypothetical protein
LLFFLFKSVLKHALRANLRVEENSFAKDRLANQKNNDYGEGEVLTFTSVFSFFVSVAGDDGLITVVLLSFFCSGGFTTVVLLSFFSAGGFATVVSFCSQAVSSARLASTQIYFFIPMNRITAPRVTPLSLKIKEIKRRRSVLNDFLPLDHGRAMPWFRGDRTRLDGAQ